MNKYITLLLIVVLFIINLSYRKNKIDNKNNYVKKLWMYWEQGIENLGIDLNKMCVEGWFKLNPDWDITVLDKKSAFKMFPELRNYENNIVQHRADLLRLKLLSKFGGVWVDTSLLPMKPLTGNIENIDNGTDIFFYRYNPPLGNIYTSNWFIISKQPNHYLIDKLLETFENKLKQTNPTKLAYFTFHNTLGELYNSDPKIKEYIDKLTIAQSLSHSNPKSIKKDINSHPLVYKRPKGISKQQYYNYLF